MTLANKYKHFCYALREWNLLLTLLAQMGSKFFIIPLSFPASMDGIIMLRNMSHELSFNPPGKFYPFG